MRKQRKIVILTATRAEYGLLKPVITRMLKDSAIDARVAVTGMHLSPEFGLTVSELESDGVRIDKKIEILLSSDSPVGLSKSMGLAMISFSDYFQECKPDGLVVLGDRFETLAVCCAATNARIPIFHIHGGEATEGLIDEAIRHSITKMSYLHFTSTAAYRKRVIQMGEDPSRVFNVGALGVENAKNTRPMTQKELEESLGFSLGEKYVVGTFHPVTLEKATAEHQTKALLEAIQRHSEYFYLFTKANADTDGRTINHLLGEYAQTHDNFRVVDSLGTKRYLSALGNASFVIGNSSSGLIEVPSFHIPTVNIGDRQKGRISGETVIDCEPTCDSIDKAICIATDAEFIAGIKLSENPYGEGTCSGEILRIIKDYMLNGKIDIKKIFYDIDFEIKEQ